VTEDSVAHNPGRKHYPGGGVLKFIPRPARLDHANTLTIGAASRQVEPVTQPTRPTHPSWALGLNGRSTGLTAAEPSPGCYFGLPHQDPSVDRLLHVGTDPLNPRSDLVQKMREREHQLKPINGVSQALAQAAL
jgi:hypothetical protein